MERPDAILGEDLAIEREEVLAIAALDEVGGGYSELNDSTRPPCIDDYDDYDDPYMEAVPPPVNYPSWTKANSFVVSGPLGDSRFPGRRFKTRGEAKAWVLEMYGFYYEEVHMKGRWGFRVPKPQVTQ